MASSKIFNSYNLVDITDEFRNAAQQLKLGELVHDEMFGLYDAMAAIELMDPKMDAGMAVNKTRKPYKFEEMIANGMVKIDGFTTEELIGIMDDTFGCLATWLNGHSLAQTVFINVFLHNPSLICDRTLKTFCIVILKMVDMINNFVLQASVFEEEDFQPKPYGFDLASATNISKIVPMIKLVEDEIKSEMGKLNENLAEQNKSYNALLTRVKFTKYFFLCLYTFKKYLYTQNALPCSEFMLQLTENLNSCDSLIDPWLETIDQGIKPKEHDKDRDSNRPDYPTIMGFEPLINQRLLAPSFPRYTKIKSRPETVQYMRDFLKRFRAILKLKEIDKFVDVIRFFDSFSMQTPSCAVTRSLLQLFYMPKQNLVFGETEFLEVVKESCRQFIKPPSLRGKNTLSPNYKELFEAFFGRGSIFFKHVIQIYGHNRASQRSKLAMVLKDLIIISEECATLEQYLSNKSFCDYLQVWILFYKFYFMSQYLLSGFELELYSVHEYVYMYFELDHLWEYLTLILKRASEVYVEHEIFLNNTTNSNIINSKTRKKHKIKIKNKSNNHEAFIVYYKAMNQMASALHYVLMAFHIENKIPPLTQSLNSEEIRYNRRFLPLLQFEGTLQSYYKYKNRYDSLAQSRQTKQLYFESCQLFKQARNHFETLKDSSFRDEVESYIKVAKTNSVVLMLLLSGHEDQGKIEFNFSEATYFPIIRFSK